MSAATNRFHVSPFWARRAVLLCGAGLSRLATAMSNTTVNTTNLETLKNCIHSGRPLITVANHDATIDDPVMFAALPCEFWHPDHMRWALGAREICFTNPLFSCFFSAGQVIPIDRGMGVMQPAMDHALTVLNQDKWVHIFPEGRVNQSDEMLRFKWGIARLILESKTRPIVLPIYTTGFRNLVPLNSFYKGPRFGKTVSITVGEPIIYEIPPLNCSDGDREKRLAMVSITNAIQRAVEDLRDSVNHTQ